MKRLIINILATTSAVIFFLMIVGGIIRGSYTGGLVQDHVLLQILTANTVIHLGLLLTRKFESKYAVLEYLLDIGYIIVVLHVFGSIFKWYPEIPWLRVIFAVVIYMFGLFTNMVRVRKEINEINELLRKRREKDAIESERAE